MEFYASPDDDTGKVGRAARINLEKKFPEFKAELNKIFHFNPFQPIAPEKISDARKIGFLVIEVHDDESIEEVK